MHWFWILCRFSARSVAFFIFVQLHGVFSGLGVHVVMRRCSVVSYVGFGFFVASQFAPWLSSFLFDYTASLLVSVFTACCVAARSSRTSVSFGFFVASQLAPWLSSFNYTTSLLTSVFTVSSLVSVLLCVVTSVLI